MLENIFNVLYDAMSSSALLAILASLLWGVLSVLLSPCHLSSIPLIVGFVASQGKMNAKKTFAISLIFSTGILITIAIIGVVTASLGRLVGDIGRIGNYIVAAIFFIVGLYLLGVIKFDRNLFGLKEVKFSGYIAALVLGLLFGLALGPCTFSFMAPVLGIVFDTAQTNYPLAMIYLLSFGIGHCAVITFAGTITGRLQNYLNWTEKSKSINWIRKICGILVILGGIYFIIN